MDWPTLTTDADAPAAWDALPALTEHLGTLSVDVRDTLGMSLHRLRTDLGAIHDLRLHPMGPVPGEPAEWWAQEIRAARGPLWWDSANYWRTAQALQQTRAARRRRLADKYDVIDAERAHSATVPELVRSWWAAGRIWDDLATQYPTYRAHRDANPLPEDPWAGVSLDAALSGKAKPKTSTPTGPVLTPIRLRN